MGPRNLLILFFSTVAVSLVILIIFFSLFFKNVDLNFNTRLPESAPDIGQQYGNSSTMNPDSKADGLMRSTVNVPPEFQEPAGNASGKDNAGKNAKENAGPDDNGLPPVTDDAALENDSPIPPSAEDETEPSAPEKNRLETTRTEKPASARSERSSSASTSSSPRNSRPVERKSEPAPPPVAMPEPLPDEVSQPSGPPVPGQ